jgi:ectoine hydroxylase-related dioxygenase (phytanoyl-CoA dioxygenase family)
LETSSTISITEKDLEIYREKGYWISPKLISDERIEKLRQAHERIWRGEIDGDGYTRNGLVNLPDDPLKLRKLDNGWWINDEIRDIVTDPLIGQLAADLMETDEVRLWHDQVLYKPGLADQVSDIGNVGWHQDFGYWQCSSTTNMVTVWLALQDTDLNNGGMMSIAGSHKWGLIPESNTFFDTNLASLKNRYATEGKEWIEEPCILKAGQASFHHALTFHGSGPNQTNDPRLSVVAHLMSKGTAFRTGVQWHPNVTHLGPRPYDGQLFANDYFPVLYKR